MTASSPLLALARRQMRIGNYAGAIEQLRQVLAVDPTDANGHALLAVCLHATKRLHAAEYEAQQALSAAPELPAAHLAAGAIQLTRRRFAAAERHLLEALGLDHTDATAYRLLADAYERGGRRQLVEPTLREGLRQAPDNPELIADLGLHLLHAGRLDEAEALAREALAIDATCADAVLLMGHVLLRRGDIGGAREQALLCLHADAGYAPALHLLCAVKMRTNPFLGLWWRFAVWMGRFGNTNTLVIIIGSYVAYRLATQLLEEAGRGNAATLLTVLWLALCAYSWAAAGLFQKMLKRELETVRLRGDF
ncbi:MAG TPA: tetratricopeptide repeat protein [Candidatus Angelobacter sp.]|nr:tetratricopeptide repeat protein [Candidatus Angelobacter sp.]